MSCTTLEGTVTSESMAAGSPASDRGQRRNCLEKNFFAIVLGIFSCYFVLASQNPFEEELLSLFSNEETGHSDGE